MTVRDEIQEIYLSEQDPFLTLQDLYRKLPGINESSIRSALHRGRKDGEFERADEGVYFFDYENYEDQLREEAETEIPIFKLYRHAKRIIDTHKKSPARNYDLDIEMTCEGYAPVKWSIQEIDDIVNPKLVARSLEVLNINGIYLAASEINFIVIGSEWRDKTIKHLEREWDVEVKLVNNVGSQYTFKGEFYVHHW